MKIIKLGIIGLGTVGTSVVRIIQHNQQKISETSGCILQIKTIVVANLDKKRKIDLTGIHLTDKIDELIQDDEIQIAIEVMGTIQPAKSYIEALLKSGKNVITANKDLLATQGSELIDQAHNNHVNLLYEASVAGGIPILRTIANSFNADQIVSVAGIVNGTSNYILTQMSENHLSYQQALDDAQALGLAENDPTSDVSGNDAAYKMAILTQFAFGATVPFDKISVHGITNITKSDIAQAQKWGYVIKLIGQSKQVGDKMSVSVEPMFVRKKSPLAEIKNENNSVMVTGSSVGEIMFYGAGAGELPTANSILSDVIATVKDIQLHTAGVKFNSFTRATELADPEERTNRYFLALSSVKASAKNIKVAELVTEHAERYSPESTSTKNTKAHLVCQTTPLTVKQANELKEQIKNSEDSQVDCFYPILD